MCVFANFGKYGTGLVFIFVIIICLNYFILINLLIKCGNYVCFNAFYKMYVR